MSVYAFMFNNEVLYIGSSFNVKKRMINHKSKLKTGVERPFYNYLRLNEINFCDLVIEIVETNFTEKPVLLEFERMFIEVWKPVCNKEIPGRNYKQYYENNKQDIIIKKKEYYQKNKEEILIQKKEYYQKKKVKFNK